MHTRTASAMSVASLAMLGGIFVVAIFAVGADAMETESMTSTADAKIRGVAPDQNLFWWLEAKP
jgi:hypothetical protein